MDVPSPRLFRSFSHPSDSSREATEGHIAHAFGGSVSFGRYMTETLDWVKFSSFSQNRYLEEAEKCLKPGHVAQKTAYFEDYYKNIAARKAKASVEKPTTETTKIAKTSSTAIDFANADDTPATSSPSSLDANGCYFIVEENESDNGRLEGSELVEEQQACAESTAAVKIPNELENVDSDVCEGNVLVKESDNEDIMASANKKKCRIPSPKSFMHSRVPNIPLPPAIKATLRPLTGGSKAATDTKKAKKRLAPTSLHSSINFASSVDKTREMTSPIRQRIRRSRVQSDTSQTSTKASSIGGTSKNNSTTSPTPNEAPVYKTSKDSSRPSRISKRSYDHETSRDSSKTLRTQASVCGTSGDNSNTLQPLRASVNRMSIVKSKASQTLNMASLSITSKRPSVTTKSEDRRTKTLNKLVSGATTGTAVSKWYSQSVNHSKSMNVSGNKSGSTTTKAVPFSFRSDERAAKRKKFFEKMEEKSDGREAEKEHLQTGSKRKIEDSWSKLRQSTGTCLKTNPNSAPHVPPPPNNHLKKIPPTQPRWPKLGRRPAAPSVQDKIAVKSSTRKSISKQALEKGHNKTASLLKKNASENASPNIQN